MDTCIICLDDLPEIKCHYCSLTIHKNCYLEYNKLECPQCKKFLIKLKKKDKIKKKIIDFKKKFPFSLLDLILLITNIVFLLIFILICLYFLFKILIIITYYIVFYFKNINF